jgi:spore maturation protein B
MVNELSKELSLWVIPILLVFIPLFGAIKRVNVYEAFVEGAAEGFQTSIRILPFLVAMLVAINVFRSSGALGYCVHYIEPVLAFFHIPSELVPLAIMRPLSGTGALGLTTEIFTAFGPDSLAGRIASTVLGSTDTTFYIVTVYFGVIGITNPRYSVFVGLCGDIIGFLGSVYLCQYFFTR